MNFKQSARAERLPQHTKPVRIPTADRPMYRSDEGFQ